MDPRPHDPFDTPLGQLQRGTGLGFVQALGDARRGREDLLGCMAADPRHDPQTEGRAVYYATLALALEVGGAEVVAVAEEVERGEPGAESYGAGLLAVEVLAEMAVRGDSGAARILESGGERALGMLAALQIRPDWCAAHVSADLVEQFAERFDFEDLVDDVEIHGPFWHPWRERIAVVERAFVDAAAIAAADAVATPAPIADPGSLATAALIQHAALSGSDRVTEELAKRDTPRDRQLLADCVTEGASMRLARIAAGLLGRLDDASLLDRAADAFAQDDDLADPERRLSGLERMRRAVYLHYVRSLPAAATLERARAWWRAGGFARTVGASVLARSAEPADREWLEAHVEKVLDRTSGWTIVSELEALGAIGDPQSEALLCAAAARVGLGVARVAALRSLAACGAQSDEAKNALELALWDGEETARELACRHAPASERADRRRRELAQDPFEDDGVVRAASEGLDR